MNPGATQWSGGIFCISLGGKCNGFAPTQGANNRLYSWVNNPSQYAAGAGLSSTSTWKTGSRWAVIGREPLEDVREVELHLMVAGSV